MSKFSLDQFLEACGASGPLRLTVEHESGTSEHVLPQPFALAGTDQRADIRSPDQRLPRRAAYLQMLEGRLLCLDLATGVRDRTGRFPPYYWLNRGKVWQCSSMSVRLADGQSDIKMNSLPARREELRPISVEIIAASNGVYQYSLKGPLALIGKSSQCQVRLRDHAVSRFHCALVHTGAGLWALDLLGRGGITVNGAAVRAAHLDEGDELRVGAFRFRPTLGPTRDIVPATLQSRPFQIAATNSSAVVAPDISAMNLQGDQASLFTLFATLQQQMMEHFRLTMTEMVGSFRQMHNEQLRLVWEELAQIRRLNEEVTSLKATKARLPGLHVAARPTEARLQAAAPVACHQEPVAATPSATSDLHFEAKAAKFADHRPVCNDAPQPGQPRPEPDEKPDVYAWVSQRIAEVQRERDGRWQKIMGFLTGTSP